MKKDELQRLKIVKVSKKRALAFCLWHDDTTTPNLNITLQGEYRGRYRCFACGEWGQLCEKELAMLNLDEGSKSKEAETVDFESLNLVYQAALNAFISKVNLWNIPGNSLLNFGMGWDNETYTFPMYDGDFNVVGIQRRFLDGGKRCVPGSKGGIFATIYCFDVGGKPWIITEGVSDAVTLYNMGFDNVIGRQSCSFDDSAIFKDLCKAYDPKSLFVIADNDEVGIKGANTFRKRLDKKYQDRCTIFVPPYKDVRAWVQVMGRRNVKNKLNSLISGGSNGF